MGGIPDYFSKLNAEPVGKRAGAAALVPNNRSDYEVQ
jgi:hypothetical protein